MSHGPALSLVEGSWVLKAPNILTLQGPVLKDHAIVIEQDLIKQILPQKELSGQKNCLDLPQTLLLPGLVNAHCHLELSRLPEALPYPGSFAGWIEQLSRLKLQMTPEQVTAAIRQGIQKLLAGGTTTVADHASVGTDLEPLFNSPLDCVSYIEVLGMKTDRARRFYEQALAKQNTHIIPTPHAPYSLLPEIFSKLTAPHLSVHVAESAEEYLLFKENRGPLFEFLASKGKTPPTIGESPLHYLHRMKLLAPRTMAVHANYLDDA
ncbi:MAG: amidohydrolase family protein, partial [Deltaproteobacteria bacterium]|nr:amidohydrolase family protein [Deltaproteobacteria bacterium]